MAYANALSASYSYAVKTIHESPAALYMIATKLYRADIQGVCSYPATPKLP